MLDHISFGVSDLARSIAFYDAILAPLGFVRVWTTADAAGYGYPNQDENFAIKQERSVVAPRNPREHVAFNAATREAAIAFHAAGMGHGAVDEGVPALCPEYGANYFAAFLRDADGHRLEAVCHLQSGDRKVRALTSRMPTPILETPTCIVRAVQMSDAASLAKHANDFEIWLNLRDAFPHPYSLADAESWITNLQDQEPTITFVIETEGEAAGAIGLTLNTDIERCSAEIGYWVGRAFWGRGIMGAAVRAVSRYGLESLGLARIYALPFARNAASCRVLAKAGFAQEGVLHNAAVKNGEILDQAMFAITGQPERIRRSRSSRMIVVPPG
jgi:RimJ/RimL family protein N-acetyltransferase/catechol 2,3-dioxygenase-like lactoylglutathione lyase family enzyme